MFAGKAHTRSSILIPFLLRLGQIPDNFLKLSHATFLFYLTTHLWKQNEAGHKRKWTDLFLQHAPGLYLEISERTLVGISPRYPYWIYCFSCPTAPVKPHLSESAINCNPLFKNKLTHLKINYLKKGIADRVYTKLFWRSTLKRVDDLEKYLLWI